MAQSRKRVSYPVVIAVLCVVSAVAITAIIYSIQVTDLQNQLNDLQQPRLVNINLGYTDDGKGIVHISGYVYNAGNVTAYGCHVDIKLTSNGAVVNSTTVYFGKYRFDTVGGADVLGETSAFVDANATYSGNPPTKVTLTLGWIAAWQIPVA